MVEHSPKILAREERVTTTTITKCVPKSVRIDILIFCEECHMLDRYGYVFDMFMFGTDMINDDYVLLGVMN